MLAWDKNISWLGIVFSIRGSALTRIRYRLLAVGAVSVVLTYVQELGHIKLPLDLPALSLMGLALGIFLGFRNNTSYDRFWEGRKLWGQLVNTSRTLTRDLLSFWSPDDEQHAFQTRQSYRVIAFVNALRLRLREETDYSELKTFLSEQDYGTVTGHENVANAILLEMARDNEQQQRTTALSDFRFLALQAHLQSLSDIQGGCERIKSTPIPRSYSILIHRIVALYVFSLPLGLVKSLHLMTPVVVLLVAYTFLGLDAVGDELEDPFGTDLNDLPLATLSRMIEVNVKQMLGEADVPPLLAPVNEQFL